VHLPSRPMFAGGPIFASEVRAPAYAQLHLRQQIGRFEADGWQARSYDSSSANFRLARDSGLGSPDCTICEPSDSIFAGQSAPGQNETDRTVERSVFAMCPSGGMADKGDLSVRASRSRAHRNAAKRKALDPIGLVFCEPRIKQQDRAAICKNQLTQFRGTAGYNGLST